MSYCSSDQYINITNGRFFVLYTLILTNYGFYAYTCMLDKLFHIQVLLTVMQSCDLHVHVGECALITPFMYIINAALTTSSGSRLSSSRI